MHHLEVGVLQPVGVFDDAVRTGAPLGLLGDTGRGAADVEGPQRELGPGLADRLRRQDADGLTHVDHVHRGQIAAVAHPADAPLDSQVSTERIPTRSMPGILDGLGGLLADRLDRPR